MNAALATLFHPFEQGLLTPPGGAGLFLNAQMHPALARFKDGGLVLQQVFKPWAEALETGGFTVSPEITAADGKFDAVLIALPKNMIEARFLLARGLAALKAGGTLVAAADNKAGGTRIVKLLAEFGLENVQDLSKNKARVVWGIKRTAEAHNDDLEKGRLQQGPHGFWSQPGMFGWDKIDKGSALLARALPADLKGRGADFGCGYGYLARHVLQHCQGVKALTCIDADARAVAACRLNLTTNINCVPRESGDLAEEQIPAFAGKTLEFLWADLTRSVAGLGNLDFIVMNPPFHEGKKTDIDIGLDFIKNAHAALHRGGRLWMVANAHLPYEEALRQVFFRNDHIAEEGGFKVFCAVK